MSEQDKARNRAKLLLAWAEGRTLLHKLLTGRWVDYTSSKAPEIHCPSVWQIKPEPRTRWVVESSGLSSCDPSFPDFWRNAGETVTEWQEVIK